MDKGTLLKDFISNAQSMIEDLYVECNDRAWEGWFCPVWVKIEDDEIVLDAGDAVSQNTTFRDSDGETPSSWVGSIPCRWSYWKEGDAEAWGQECHADPSEYDYEDSIRGELWESEKFDESVDAIIENVKTWLLKIETT